MAERRPDVPRAMEREVLVEAGHRCAIPTCGAETTEIAHIVPWATVREHTFDNLIALCPNCHTRFDKGQIDRQSMLRYKANLSVVSGRYGDLEQRVLRVFADNPTANFIDLPGGQQIHLLYLLRDGLLADTGMAPWATQVQGANTHDRYVLTEKGRAFIHRWLTPDPLL